MVVNPWLDRLLDVVLSPALWLGVALAFVYGTLFTLWCGGGWRAWRRDLWVGLVGFGIGQALGMLFHSTWLRVGQIQLLWGTLAAAAALVIGRRFAK